MPSFHFQLEMSTPKVHLTEIVTQTLDLTLQCYVLNYRYLATLTHPGPTYYWSLHAIKLSEILEIIIVSKLPCIIFTATYIISMTYWSCPNFAIIAAMATGLWQHLDHTILLPTIFGRLIVTNIQYSLVMFSNIINIMFPWYLNVWI